MFFYLTCAVECAVKLDGKYVGRAGENYFIFETDKETLIELLPLDNVCLPLNYLLTPKPKTTQNMRIIDLCAAYLLIPSFARRSVTDFKLLGHGRYEFNCGQVAVNCYSENGVRLVVETAGDMFVTTLPFMPDEARFERAESNGAEYLICTFIKERTLILAFSINDKITLCLKRICDDFSIAPPFISLTENKNDLLRHVIISRWKLEKTIIGTDTEVRRRKEPYALDEKLIPYAFFEELKAGGDVSDMLTPKLKPRADEFAGFLGDYSMILPPPHFLKDGYILLIYADKAEYARVKLCGGLIENVTLCNPSETDKI